MIMSFEELRVQAENTRLEMCFKLKEEAEKVDKFEKECKLEVSMKENQGKVEGLLVKKKDLEATVENLQEREKEMKNVLQIREEEIHDLKLQLTSTAEKEQNYLKQLTTLNTDLEREALKNEQLTVYINKLLLEKEQIAQEKSGMATELKKLQENHEAKNIENEISRKEKQLKILENKFNNVKKQVENKTKCIEELQQENKVLKKKITAESKKTSTYEVKVNKLQLEMENMNKQHKETVDIYQKDIETKKVNENKLLEEVEKMRLLADEATVTQRETDIRCQHKITEMVALMEKHKHEYDKMVEEKDAELNLYKIKEQEQLSSKRSLESELSCLKNELSSLKEQLKAEIEEKKMQTHFCETPKPHLDLDGESIDVKNKKSPKDIPIKVNMMEKKKMPPSVSAKSPLGSPSLESIVSEEEMFKKLYKDYPQASQLYAVTPKKKSTTSNMRTPGSVLKLTTMRKMREAGWTAVSKMDRKRKIKEAEKLFT